MSLHPGGVIAWLVVGVLAGWLAGFLTRSKGVGCFGNIIIGLLGAAIGGFVFSIFRRARDNGLLGFGRGGDARRAHPARVGVRITVPCSDGERAPVGRWG
jgi:uncharacterized membrane protein YeaQ/YmgE (transglycosylase-associated protein family)